MLVDEEDTKILVFLSSLTLLKRDVFRFFI